MLDENEKERGSALSGLNNSTYILDREHACRGAKRIVNDGFLKAGIRPVRRFGR